MHKIICFHKKSNVLLKRKSHNILEPLMSDGNIPGLVGGSASI